jgi:hypothetical protein
VSSTERKVLLVLKQPALVTVDDKDLVAIHSLTQLAVRGQTDTGDRRTLAAAFAQALEWRLAVYTINTLQHLHIHYPHTYSTPTHTHTHTPSLSWRKLCLSKL